MAQTFTLDEAAHRLGMTVEEFKRRLRTEWTTVRSFRDGPTLRFRSADIDELARMLGEASDPGLNLGGGKPLTDSSEEDVPLIMSDMPRPTAKPPSSGKKKPALRKPPEEPLNLESDTDDIFTMPASTGGSSSSARRKKSPPQQAGDSDVRLDMAPSADDPNAGELTEEITLDFDPPSMSQRSGILKPPSSMKLTGAGSGKLVAPSSGKFSPGGSNKLGAPGSAKHPGAARPPAGPDSAKIPGPGAPVGDDSSSEFELTLDSDSDSFELNLNTDNSDEVALGGDDFDNRGEQSGINLGRPADSGLSLEKRKPALDPEVDSDVDFELSLDAPGLSGTRLGSPRSGVRMSDSDSEFELSLDDSGLSEAYSDDDLAGQSSHGDIFETDFELPLVSDEDSGSEVVAIESSDTDLENSDFDIAIDTDDAPVEDDQSASQVILVDDEDAAAAGLLDDDGLVEVDEDDQPRSRKGPRSGKARRSNLLDEGFDDDLSADVELEDGDEHIGEALMGPSSGRRRGADDVDMPDGPGYVAPPRWGVLPAILLLPCLIVVAIGALTSYEMVRGQTGYQQNSKQSDTLVRGLAKQFDFKVSD